MTKLPWAKMSPRIENGVIFWYEGDTFRLNLHLELKDQDGLPVVLVESDSLELTFYNRSLDPITTLSFAGEAVQKGFLPVVMGETLTSRFSAGRYTYDLQLRGEERTTLIRGGEIIVE